jgi:hypothetical protein
MSNPITDTTQLQCDKGTKPTALIVTSQTFMKIDGKLQATEDDIKPNENIMPFGQCKLKMYSGGLFPCMPAPIKWQDVSAFDIDNKKELLDESTCPCSVGGKISVIKSAQAFVAEE